MTAVTQYLDTAGNYYYVGDNTSAEARGFDGNDTLDAGSFLIWPTDGSDKRSVLRRQRQ
jgi:hypothetical protein